MKQTLACRCRGANELCEPPHLVLKAGVVLVHVVQEPAAEAEGAEILRSDGLGLDSPHFLIEPVQLRSDRSMKQDVEPDWQRGVFRHLH